jgi:hypothetical protein
MDAWNHASEEKIAQLERQVGLLRIRLDQEQREIKALQYEVQVKHTARFLAFCCPLALSICIWACVDMCVCVSVCLCALHACLRVHVYVLRK